jgi:hypothetical protein
MNHHPSLVDPEQSSLLLFLPRELHEELERFLCWDEITIAVTYSYRERVRTVRSSISQDRIDWFSVYAILPSLPCESTGGVCSDEEGRYVYTNMTAVYYVGTRTVVRLYGSFDELESFLDTSHILHGCGEKCPHTWCLPYTRETLIKLLRDGRVIWVERAEDESIFPLTPIQSQILSDKLRVVLQIGRTCPDKSGITDVKGTIFTLAPF